MYTNKYFNILVVLLLLVSLTGNSQEKENDSVVTPFRKGRWFTGLSGTINSSTIKLQSTGENTSTNEFGINLTTGKFIKDRFLIGGTLTLNRSNNSGIVERTSENIFIAPLVSYFISKNKQGSLFFQLAPGYVRYKDETRIEQADSFVQQLGEGGGFGSLVGIGYSYAFFDLVTFDLGLKLNLLWINVDQEALPANTVTSEDIFISNISFSFGFNILVDQF
ncbi:hypothetical protein [uncultured Aquimarina sp.]|uniref:hypothetical protein n=1 Tax=uncultured Aquimarina sp. TaxID=575652 RepID=UPI002610B9D5|nr:hypothetical protein [uncultured Aquimarina sp.]